MPFAAGDRLTAQALNDAIGYEVYRTTTESVTNSTVLQDDDQLVLPVSFSAVYAVDALIIYDGGGGNLADLKMQFTGPPGATFTWANFGVNPNNLISYNVATEQIAAGSQRAVGTNGTTQMSCRPAGTLTTTDAGTLRFRWAQNIANATPTRVITGSRLRIVRID